MTDTQPKALVEVHGVSLLERQLERLRLAGVDRVVINLGWRGECIAERIGDGSRFGMQAVYSPEYDDLLDTGGGIYRALPMLGPDPFWVLNADVFSDFSLPPPDLAPGYLGHLVLVPVPQYRSRGDFDLTGRKVGNAAEPGWTFSGMAVYRPELFKDAAGGRFPLAPLLFAAADRGQLSGEIFEGAWEDVGTVHRLARLNQAADAG